MRGRSGAGWAHDVVSVAVELLCEPVDGEGDGEEVDGVACPCEPTVEDIWTHKPRNVSGDRGGERGGQEAGAGSAPRGLAWRDRRTQTKRDPTGRG